MSVIMLLGKFKWTNKKSILTSTYSRQLNSNLYRPYDQGIEDRPLNGKILQNSLTKKQKSISFFQIAMAKSVCTMVHLI